MKTTSSANTENIVKYQKIQKCDWPADLCFRMMYFLFVPRTGNYYTVRSKRKHPLEALKARMWHVINILGQVSNYRSFWLCQSRCHSTSGYFQNRKKKLHLVVRQFALIFNIKELWPLWFSGIIITYFNGQEILQCRMLQYNLIAKK